jgi:O-antigen/teichoic acid export membrane protein
MTFAQPLLLLGKEKKYLSLVAWSAGLNLVLNLFMIPWLGMTGAALTTVGAESVVAYRSWRIMKSVVHSTYTREMIELTAIAGCSFLLGSLCKAIFTWNLIIAGVSFIVIYAVLTLLWMFRQRKAMTEPV